MEHTPTILMAVAALFCVPLLAFIAYTLDDLARTHRAIAGCLFAAHRLERK